MFAFIVQRAGVVMTNTVATNDGPGPNILCRPKNGPKLEQVGNAEFLLLLLLLFGGSGHLGSYLMAYTAS